MSPQTIPCDEWICRTLSDGTLEITGYTGNPSVLTIPDAINGKPVTAIGSRAFANQIKLTTLQIPGSIYQIGDNAFEGCSALERAEISLGVNIIGGEAFRNCSALTEITIPESVRRISDCAFEGCTGLREVTLQEGLSTIGEGAFCKCKSLASMVIPASVTDLDDWIFMESGIREVWVYRYSEAARYCRMHWIPYRYIENPDRLHNRLRALLNRYHC